MREALAAASLWGKLRMQDDQKVYAVGSKDKSPLCSGATALKMCELGWLKPRQWRGQFEFEITGQGREIKRRLNR